MTSQRFCLRWNNHQSNLLSVFDQLLHDESFVDVTLAVEGQLLKAHKMVLSACSPYFQALFVSHPDKHPIVILKDVPFADMRSLLDFMYRGEVSVDQDRLTAFLKVAESLRIKGLTEVNEERPDLPSIASSLLSNSQQTAPSLAAPPPPPNLHRIHLSQPSSTSSSPSNAKRSAPSPSNFSSYAAHGPPDLLEVNMTEHSQNSPSSFSEEQNVGSPEQICTPDISDDCCIKSEPGDDSLTAGTSFQDRKSPQIRDNSSSRSQSQTPTNQSERFPPDRCHWKEILKRLKKPEISIRVENDKNEESSGRRSGESASSKTGGGGGNNNSYYESFASGSGKGVGNSDSVWFTDSSQGSQYYMEVEGDDMDDDDDAIIKYEYEGTMRTSSMMANNSNSSPGNAAASVSGSGGASGAAHQSDQTKPLDKSSVRRYCVQVAEHLYQCTLCYKTYTHISNFSRHFLSAHHGLRQEIPCPVCFRIFTRRDNMLTHMKQVHRITVTRGLATSLIQKLSAANESGSNSTESQVNSN